MKKIVLAATVAGLALIATPAMASNIDINVGLAAMHQRSAATVNQVAGSGNLSFGGVSGSNITSTGANINNDVTQDVDVSNLQATTYGGELGVAVASQVSQKVNQVAVSVNGEGSVAGSTLNSTAANLNNDAQQHVTVH